jgi:hypothetical protein
VFRYTAYNLHITSELHLPELTVRDSDAFTPDVIFKFGNVRRAPDPARADEPQRWENEQGVCIYRPKVGAFAVQAGREVVIDPLPCVDEAALRIFLLGPALALLLHQRNLFVLHASAIGIRCADYSDELCGVAFLGHSGAGKSTTAAALYKHGCIFVADDLIAADPSRSPPQIFPAFPQLKLYPNAAAAALNENWETLPRAHPDFLKRTRILDDEFNSAPLDLARIYVLAYGDTERIEVLSAHEAVVELIRHTYGARYVYSSGAGIHLTRCALIATQVTVRRMVRRRDMTRMKSLIELIRHDLESLSSEHRDS